MPGMTITISTLLSLFGLGVAYFYMRQVMSVPLDLGLEGEQKSRLKFIHGAIAEGAMAFLKQEYKFLAIFMTVFAAIIAVLIDDVHTTGATLNACARVLRRAGAAQVDVITFTKVAETLSNPI